MKWLRLPLNLAAVETTPSQLEQYIPILFILAAAVGFAGGTLVMSVLFGKYAKTTPAKDAAYECGKDPIGTARGRFSVKFYLVAMLFILFDIEVVFLYPWAVVYRDMLAGSCHAEFDLCLHDLISGHFICRLPVRP